MKRQTLISMAAFALFAIEVGSVGQTTSGQKPYTSPPVVSCPDAAQVQNLLMEAGGLMQKADFKNAVVMLQASSLSGCDPNVSLLLAGALDGLGNRTEAEEVLTKAHGLWPANISIATSLARYELVNGHSVDAAGVVGECHPSTSTPLRELQVIVVTYLSNHDLIRAQAIAELALKGYPSEESLLLLANTLQLQGRYEDVIELLNKDRSLYPASAPFLITVAESEFDASEFETARSDLQKAISIDTQSYPAHYLLGNTLMRLGRVADAIAEYQVAISLNPTQPRTYHQLAIAQEAKQDQAGAQESLKRALVLDPCYAAAYSESGKILLRSQKAAEAVEMLIAATRCDPSFEEAYYLLIQAYSRIGDKAKSAQAQQTWLALKNTHKLEPASTATKPSAEVIR